MSIKKLSFMLLSAFALAALLNGCSDSKAGPSTPVAVEAPAGHVNALYPAADAVSPAMYLATNTKSCTNCHNPSNLTPTDTHRAYAESGHGDVNGVAWSAEDFKANAACVRCHTTTGYISYVTSNFVVPGAFGTGDSTREVLACSGCHTSSDNFANSVRDVAAFSTTGLYTANGESNLFPDVGESNVCIPCHSGRASQADILALSDAAMSKTSFKNPHYLPAAGIMYLKAGFINFTSAVSQVGTTYYKSYRLALLAPNATTGLPNKGGVPAQNGGVTGGVGSAHRGLGTPTIRGGETWQTAATYGLWETKGPCVTCHLNADVTNMPKFTGDTTKAPFLNTDQYGKIPTVRSASGHSLSATSYDAAKQVCIPCHNDAGGFDNPNLAAEEKLTEAKPYFLGGLAVITKLLDAKNITFDNSTYPYFYNKGTTTAVTDWTLGGTLTPAKARKLMGACYNLKLLTTDKGAYVHGRSYSQRLIFDTIDFLDDGVMNASSAATIVAYGDKSLFPSTDADHWLFKAAGVRK